MSRKICAAACVALFLGNCTAHADDAASLTGQSVREQAPAKAVFVVQFKGLIGFLPLKKDLIHALLVDADYDKKKPLKQAWFPPCEKTDPGIFPAHRSRLRISRALVNGQEYMKKPLVVDLTMAEVSIVGGTPVALANKLSSAFDFAEGKGLRPAKFDKHDAETVSLFKADSILLKKPSKAWEDRQNTRVDLTQGRLHGMYDHRNAFSAREYYPRFKDDGVYGGGADIYHEIAHLRFGVQEFVNISVNDVEYQIKPIKGLPAPVIEILNQTDAALADPANSPADFEASTWYFRLSVIDQSCKSPTQPKKQFYLTPKTGFQAGGSRCPFVRFN